MVGGWCFVVGGFEGEGWGKGGEMVEVEDGVGGADGGPLG